MNMNWLKTGWGYIIGVVLILMLLVTGYALVKVRQVEGVAVETATRVYETCVALAESRTLFNAQQNALADVDRRALTRTESAELTALWNDRIAVYEAGVRPIPDCESLRPKP